LGIRGLDNDDLRTFLNNFNFLAGFQIACGVGLRAHSLDGGESGFLLQGRGFAKSRGPGNILGEIIEHGRELREGLNGGIPGLLLDGTLKSFTGKIRIAFEEVIGFDYLIGVSGAAQNLSDERIGIERDGSDECVEIVVRQIGVFFLEVGRSCGKILGNGEKKQGQTERSSQKPLCEVHVCVFL
jgi:hypothetical protein